MRSFLKMSEPFGRWNRCFGPSFLNFSLLSLRNREAEPIAIRAETAARSQLESRLETAHISWLETDLALKPR